MEIYASFVWFVAGVSHDFFFSDVGLAARPLRRFSVPACRLRFKILGAGGRGVAHQIYNKIRGSDLEWSPSLILTTLDEQNKY